jgi:hypothetical protein
MPHTRLASPSLVLSAFVAMVLTAPPASAQAPRPGQLAPGPGQPQRGPTQPTPPQAPPGGPQAQQPAPPKPYKPIPVTLVQPSKDPSFEAFRKQLADIVSRKDRAALARMIVANNFFWMGEKGDKANKRKPGIDNLAAAINLDAKDGSGWQALAEVAGESTLEPIPDRKGVMCAPASPTFDEKAAEQVAKDTGTDFGDWGFPSKPGVEVRAAAQPNAPVIDKLGMNLVRIMPEQPPAGAPPPESPFLRVVTPSGKVGYALEEFLSSLDVDQICYVKDASGWKITGYAGGN